MLETDPGIATREVANELIVNYSTLFAIWIKLLERSESSMNGCRTT